jgi:hypothetical protein
MITKVGKSVKVGVADQINMAAVASAPTIRATFGNSILSTEADTTIAPFTGNYNYPDLVNKQSRPFARKLLRMEKNHKKPGFSFQPKREYQIRESLPF